MINWNEVTVGETEIVSPFDVRQLVAGLHLDNVWTFNPESGDYDSWNKAAFTNWTIYDPWEDVSEECSINEWGRVEHNGEIIDFKPNVYKRSEKGLRVWKRKEG